jgi:hypothetical protein
MSSISERHRIDEPKSYFIYEQLGERSVDPETLIECAIELWLQCASDYSVTELWEVAHEMLDSQERSPDVSWAEHLRLSIITGSTVPRGWKDASSFPFKGLLISAIYLREAKFALTSKIPGRAWHLIATAYYHLGLNTTESEPMAQARKLAEKNSSITEEARALVLAALGWVERNRRPRSIAEAQEMVIELLERKGGAIDELLLVYADKARIDPSQPKTYRRFDAIQRIRNLMRDWALPTSPYPEIARKFAQFNQRKEASGPATPVPESPRPEGAGGAEPAPGPALEIISIRADGYTLTTRISKADPAADA